MTGGKHLLYNFLVFTCVLTAVSAQNITDNYRFNCYPETNGSATKCAARGCIWKKPNNTSLTGVPYCYYTKNYGYEVITEVQRLGEGEYVLELQRINTPWIYPDHFDKLKVHIHTYTTHLRLKVPVWTGGGFSSVLYKCTYSGRTCSFT